MLTKTNVIKTISKFPDNFSIDELVEEMILLDKIERGIQDADNGRVISENELDKRIEEWSNTAI
jgi:predicted transcriptional regulator